MSIMAFRDEPTENVCRVTAPLTFMSLVVSLALVIWAGTLIWLLYEQARLGRGPSPRDSLRTHIPG